MSDSERSDWGTAAVRRLLGKHRKTIVRRFVFLVLVVMYTPVAISAFHTYLCSDSIPVVSKLCQEKSSLGHFRGLDPLGRFSAIFITWETTFITSDLLYCTRPF